MHPKIKPKIKHSKKSERNKKNSVFLGVYNLAGRSPVNVASTQDYDF